MHFADRTTFYVQVLKSIIGVAWNSGEIDAFHRFLRWFYLKVSYDFAEIAVKMDVMHVHFADRTTFFCGPHHFCVSDL